MRLFIRHYRLAWPATAPAAPASLSIDEDYRAAGRA
jgi:hypothetical protein